MRRTVMSALIKRILAIVLVLSLATSMAVSLSSCKKKGEEAPGPAGPAGADGANGSDGLTPFIGENGNWWIGSVDTGVPAAAVNGRDGKDGLDAITPTFTYDAESGYLCISYGDESDLIRLVNISDIVADGKDGTSVSSCEINAAGELVIQYSDGRSENLGTIVAANGKDGKDGKDGTNGVGIADIAIDDAGNLTVTLTSGTVYELGNVKGADGLNGTNGLNGSNGTNGTNGITPQLKIDTVSLEWQVSYDNGTTWKSLEVRAVGNDGANGSNGTNGTDGVTPTLKIDSENQWQVSYDNGKSWQPLGAVATGATGANGISPRLRITDGYWEVSYNNGTTWESLGVKAEGSDGANGSNGRGIASMEIIEGYLYVTYTDSTTPVNIGKVGTEIEGGDAPVTEPYTEGLEFYPMNNGASYGVCIGKAIYMEHIVIPSTYNGKPVTTILAKGFTTSEGMNDVLKSIVIPSSIVEIRANAFEYCIALENVTIPASVTVIADYAFVGVKCVTFEISKSEMPDGAEWEDMLGCGEIKWKE